MQDLLKSLSWLGTLLAAILAAVWSFLTYQDKSRIDFQKPLVTQTLSLCFEVSKTVSDLVSEPDRDKWFALRARFLSLYHGELVLIEDQQLAGSMKEFGDLIAVRISENRDGISPLALKVSYACRSQLDKLMAEGWKLDTSVLQIQAIKIDPIQGTNK
jgi:hypothetical protein